MAQVSKLMIFMVTMVAAATAIGASGLGAWTGLNPQTGAADDVNQSKQELHNYSATRQEGEVNFIGSIFSSAGKVMSSFGMIFTFGSVLQNLGLPPWAVEFVVAPLTFLFGLFFIYLLSGRRTTKRI